jgi:hypothetical protein
VVSVTEKLGGFLADRTSRRSFLARGTMAATALSVAPVDFLVRPGSAYAAVCECVPGTLCDCSSTCCNGYTEFCCTINNGINACPPGTFAGGWWKADGSAYCAGPRYYIDCLGECHGCGCGGGVFCPGCDGLTCECALGNCNDYHIGCAEFRYGQCHQEITCSGRISCRVVSCTPPWQLDPTCTTVSATDDTTANQTAACLTTPPPPVFRAVPGTATDIAAGANGSVWVISTKPVPGGYELYEWNGSGWYGVAGGGGVLLAVGPNGSPWLVNSHNQIYERTGSSWIVYPGTATDIAIGADGAVWVVGTKPAPGGYAIYRWTGREWAVYPGGAVRIAVGPDGSPWVVNSKQEIYHWTGSAWKQYPGLANAIAVGADGSVWVIGANPVPGGYGIYQWTGRAWEEFSGGAVAITVLPDGQPWIVNSHRQIYARTT